MTLFLFIISLCLFYHVRISKAIKLYFIVCYYHCCRLIFLFAGLRLLPATVVREGAHQSRLDQNKEYLPLQISLPLRLDFLVFLEFRFLKIQRMFYFVLSLHHSPDILDMNF